MPRGPQDLWQRADRNKEKSSVLLSCGKRNRNNGQRCKKEEEDAFFHADKNLVRLVWHASGSGIAHWIAHVGVSDEYYHSKAWMGSRHIHEHGPGNALVCSSAVSVSDKWGTCVEVYIGAYAVQREPGFVKGVSFLRNLVSLRRNRVFSHDGKSFDTTRESLARNWRALLFSPVLTQHRTTT